MADAPSFSVLFGTANFWDPTKPSYADILAAIGAGSSADKNAASASTLNFANQNPICYAFVLAREEDHVYIGHTPSIYPADISPSNVYNNFVTLLVSDRVDSVIPMVLPMEAFGHTIDILSHNVDALTGPNGHGHAPPLMHTGPHTASDPNVTTFHICYVMPLPTELSTLAIKDAFQGHYTLIGFWNKFLTGPHSSPDHAIQMAYHPLINWW